MANVEQLSLAEALDPRSPASIHQRLRWACCAASRCTTTSTSRHGRLLVEETLVLVQQHMPEADTSVLRRKPGERQAP
jgi:hypothetical protein